MTTKAPIEARISFADSGALRSLAGPQSRFLGKLGRQVGVKITQRGNSITLHGPAAVVRGVRRAIEQMYLVAQQGQDIDAGDLLRAAQWNLRDPKARADSLAKDAILLPGRGKAIVPKTPTQRSYLEAIHTRAVVFGVGPAGTGKTYLAMAMAVAAYRNRLVERIILARPAVEAGERLGFLPGTIAEKVHPYLRPLYDALHDMMDFEEATSLMERDVIEVAPLAFMRGRTLHDSFVVLDEAQNTTIEQMKMFLTRLGEHSQAVITGDITQIDLPANTSSGLCHALEVLAGVTGIGVVHFSAGDVLRHPLVQQIVLAYERSEADAADNQHDPIV